MIDAQERGVKFEQGFDGVWRPAPSSGSVWASLERVADGSVWASLERVADALGYINVDDYNRQCEQDQDAVRVRIAAWLVDNAV